MDVQCNLFLVNLLRKVKSDNMKSGIDEFDNGLQPKDFNLDNNSALDKISMIQDDIEAYI